MPVTDPKRWFLPAYDTPRQPTYTTGNTVTAYVDGKNYFRDLKSTLDSCDRSLLISGWRVSSGQILDPVMSNGTLSGVAFGDAISRLCKSGVDVKALLFNVPGTDVPGPFRLWHALDNREFCDRVIAAGGDAILDSRLSLVPASSHHQKFVAAIASDPAKSAGFLGGIDICYDRWDQPAHDQAAERQRDFVRAGVIETHQPSQPGWHDIHAKVQGPAVAQIWKAFRDRWNDPRPPNIDPLLNGYCGRTRIDGDAPLCPPVGRMAVQINQTLPAGFFPSIGGAGEQTIERAHCRAIDQAEHYIYIEDQYVWPCAMVGPLEAALRRGVYVVLVVARDYDAPGLSVVAKRLRREVVDRLQAAGPSRFKIFHLERDNGEQIYVHSKIIIIDDVFVSLGSANFNARSLKNDTEIQASIIDSETLQVPFDGVPETVCRFAHDLRCELWAEHLQVASMEVRDPIQAIHLQWGNRPAEKKKRAVPHEATAGIVVIDPIAEYITTLITNKLAHVPFVTVPEGISERSQVKLVVESALRGPLAAVAIKFMEEMLNPDLTQAIAAVERRLLRPLRDSVRVIDGLIHPEQITSDRALALATVRRLRKGQLPKMVDWIDPILLGTVAVRTVISKTIGQYADQRPLQAAIDDVTNEELCRRHDYSDVHGIPPPGKAAPDNPPLPLDAEGRVWLDFTADLGDGFEATYAIAYLLAASRLDVKGKSGETLSLPNGEVLVFGGDLAYPNATIKEYQDRCITPYELAFRTSEPKRHLFFIAGNHDWYDGLTAFTSVFCTARDRYTHGVGKQIGGWTCRQRRSYFALKLPYDWWLWGVDLGLTDNIDDAQLDYFHAMSDATKPGDKIIIITHAPAWVNQDVDGLHQISMIARARGARLCAVLAGDLHHYSRYYSDELGVHLITSGGGGAFTHATHQLKSRMKVDWAVETGGTSRVAQADDRPAFNREEREAVPPGAAIDFTEKNVSVSAGEQQTASDQQSAWAKSAHDFISPNFYPARWQSRLLVLKNLWLPFHNWRFGVLLGIIYTIFGWVFQLSVADPIDGMRKAQYVNADLGCLEMLKYDAPIERMRQCQKDAYKKVDDVLDKLQFSLPPENLPKPNLPQVHGEPTRQQVQVIAESLARELKTLWDAILLTVSPKRVLFGMLNNPAFLIMVLGLWIGLVHYVDALWKNRVVNLAAKVVLGTMHFLAHMALLLIMTTIFEVLVYRPLVDGRNGIWTIVGGLAGYTGLIVIFGALLGGMVWGAYWALTSALFGMHMDAFSALGIRHYKNFLRMSFEPDRLTIYPIALDTVPGRKGWRAPDPGEQLPAHNPLLVPTKPLAPRLIEEPIIIEVGPRTSRR